MLRELSGFLTKFKKASNTNKVIAAVLAVSVAVVGYSLYRSLAADYPTMYVQPSGASVSAGQVLTVEIRVDTAGQSTNAVQADLTYSTNFFEFQSINSSASAYGIDAQATGGSGSVSIARGNISGVSGDVLVAAVSFKVIAGSGTGSINFSDSSVLLRASDSSDILASTIDGSYTVPSSGSGSNPAPAAAPPPAAAPTSPNPQPGPSASRPASPNAAPQASPAAPSPPGSSAPSPLQTTTSGQEQLATSQPATAKKPAENNQLYVVAGVVSAAIIIVSGLALFLRSRISETIPSGSHFNEPRTGEATKELPSFKPGEWNDPYK